MTFRTSRPTPPVRKAAAALIADGYTVCRIEPGESRPTSTATPDADVAAGSLFPVHIARYGRAHRRHRQREDGPDRSILGHRPTPPYESISMASPGPRRVVRRRTPPSVIDLTRSDDREPTTDAKGREWPPIPDDALPVDIVLPRLHWVTQRAPNQWTACCPSHPDSRPSCSITELPDGVLLVHCFSGCDCDAETICAALGLSLAHLYPTPYALRRSGTQRPAVGSTPVSSAVDP